MSINTASEAKSHAPQCSGGTRAGEYYSLIARAMSAGGTDCNRLMHETLVLVCADALKGTGLAYGNLFSQVSALCRRCGMSRQDTMEAHAMRRDTAGNVPPDRTQMLYNARALAMLVAAAFGEAVPDALASLLPAEPRRQKVTMQPSYSHVRCMVRSVEGCMVTVEADLGEGMATMQVDMHGTLYDHGYMLRSLRDGTQLNLLGCMTDNSGVLLPRIVVYEPDFLLDISAIAACFEEYGHHPLLYTVNRMRQRVNTRHTLLGNFSGAALDDIINNPGADLAATVRSNFRDKALEYSTCDDFDPDTFMQEAARQSANIRQAVENLFATASRDLALLEPSFVCERLGIQGRVDLMTSDKRLLVEQKSGTNMYVANNRPNRHGSLYVEKHYVQVLLYYGVLRHNFDLHDRNIDVRLLYSKYEADRGLLSVEMYDRLFAEAMAFRNRVVASEYYMVGEGFGRVLPSITPQCLNTEGMHGFFYERYLLPQLMEVTAPLQAMDSLERKYFCTMMTFVMREQLLSKVGAQEGVGNSVADLWNMPLDEKLETGNICMGLTLAHRRSSSHGRGYDTLLFTLPRHDDSFLPNFRRGDMIYVYAYDDGDTPDVRRAILFKGVIADINAQNIEVRLNDAQQNPRLFTCPDGTGGGDVAAGAAHDGTGGGVNRLYAIEHAGSDANTSAAMHSLLHMMTAPASRRDLLLSRREPARDTSAALTRCYGDDEDDLLLKAKQASDYFLVVGPPGTGKTSRTMRHIVEEELASGGTLLLMSYTNRAVDEICAMLSGAGIDYLRIGNEHSCDPACRSRLVTELAGNGARLADIRARLAKARVIVATTAGLMARPFVFALKSFTLAVVDEAGQITEPNIVGILSAHSPDQPDRLLIGRFILIGDYKQLPAVVRQTAEESVTDDPDLNAMGLVDCRQSLFERLIRHERAQGRDCFTGVLRRQGRMHPDVAHFPSLMFYHEERLAAVPCPHQQETSLGYDCAAEDSLDETLQHRRMVFIAACDRRADGLTDKVNMAEARVVADVLRRIRRYYGERFDPGHTVGVIVPYRNQIAMIRSEIASLAMPELQGVSIDTVERYQGSQRDVIVYSFTAHSQWQMDFLTSNCFEEAGRTVDRKLNVVLTRARCQTVMTGDPTVLRRNGIFERLIDYVAEHGGYVAGQESRVAGQVWHVAEDESLMTGQEGHAAVQESHAAEQESHAAGQEGPCRAEQMTARSLQ